jgi:hypothetical protein
MVRALLTFIFLILFGGLAWLSATWKAPDIQNRVSAEAETIAADSGAQFSVAVAGRDVTIEGVAQSDSERDLLIESLNAIPGRRAVRDMIRVEEAQSPFTLSATQTEGGL